MKILIALTVALMLAGCTTDSAEAGNPSTPTEPTPTSSGTSYVNETGTLTTNPLLPTTATGEFEMGDVPVARAHFVGQDLALTLTAPDGSSFGPGELIPQNGTWAWEVSGSIALQTAWSMSIEMASEEVGTGFLYETVSVAPGQFFEINTQMPQNGTFCWDWTSGSDLAFDVHSHFDDEVQYLVELTASEDKDCFTNEREGGYSLLWENGGATPVSLTYTVWGDFEVDSYFPPR